MKSTLVDAPDCHGLNRNSTGFILPGLALLSLLLCSTAIAAPPDLTTGGMPSSTKRLNLGATGSKGWVYHVNTDTSESRQILVTTVEAGSPSAGVLAVNDVILGANGTGATPQAFTSDARKSFALAIADAEAKNPAELKMLRWRAGVTTTVTITMQTMGAYSATAPYNCPKSALILERGLQYVTANQGAGRFSLGALALMAANDPGNPQNAARQNRAKNQVLAAIPTQEQINEMLAGNINTGSKITWELGHKLIVLAEYHLQTGDPQVLPGIEAYAVQISNGQSHLGTMGHQLTDREPDGSLNGSYNVGYGTVNSAAMPCFLGLLLAKECGVNAPQVAPAIDRASRFFASYSGFGAHPYGEHDVWRRSHEGNGKSGLAALCFSLQGNRDEEGKFFAQMATASASERMEGHTGPYFNYLWACLGAGAGGEEAAASHFSRISWMLDLDRRWDGGFDFHTFDDGGNGATPAWQTDFYMYTPALLTYALPLRQLKITGSDPNAACQLAGSDVAEAATADSYDPTLRTTNELISDLGGWSPKVQWLAAVELGDRTSAHASAVPALIATAGNTNAARESRVGACYALGEIGNGSAAPLLAGLLDHPDLELRYAATFAMRYMPQADRLAHLDEILVAAASTSKPFFPVDEEDPQHFAHYQVSMLLFYTGAAAGPGGVISRDGINGVDRSLLYPAIRAVAGTPNGLARSSLKMTYPYLTQADVDALADVIVDSTQFRAPADKMFSAGVRLAGLDALERYNIAEGPPLSRIIFEESGLNDEDRVHAMAVLERYAASSDFVLPDPQIDEFCEFLVFKDSTQAPEAQAVLDAMAADTNPVPPTPFKSIQSVTADQPILTLPSRWTTLRVSSTDLADGNPVYTWRKVRGAGNVTISPNGTSDAKEAVILFDGVPGSYLFEVKMSDSRNLTEVFETVAVTLHQAGGGLPANTPPLANQASITVQDGVQTPITLTGSDPEGYALNFAISAAPANGVLTGDAPFVIYTANPGYVGADSFTFEVIDSEGQTSAAIININVDPSAGVGLAVYEPFNYPVGGLHGRSGASEVGLAGTWNASSNTQIAAGSLAFGALSVTGNSIGNLAAVNSYGGARGISTSALAANGLLNDGATLWFSMVAGLDPTANGAHSTLAFALANSQFNSGNAKYWINDEGAQKGSGIGVVAGRLDAIQKIVAAEFQDVSVGAVVNYGTVNEEAVNIHQPGERGLIVGKIIWGAQEDRIEIYQPMENLDLPQDPVSVLTVNVNQSTFDTLTFTRGDKVIFDEVRFGGTYHGVLHGSLPMTADASSPVPNPMSFEVLPVHNGDLSVSMAATPAYDATGVEYYFTCTTGGGHDSGWQTSPVYTDVGLNPGVLYGYTVKARDKSPARNETAPAAVATVMISPQAVVPGVVSMPAAGARGIITGLGLMVGSETKVFSETAPFGTIISQSPAGASVVAYGSAVNLVISKGTGLSTVPNAVGLPQGTAQSGILAAGLMVGTVTSVNSTSVPVGMVISQSPTGGLVVNEGSSVNLVVSLGPVQVTAPNVTGLPQATATSNIVAAGLVTGTVGGVYSSTIPLGNVISQSPNGGVILNEGSSVNLVVSLGPEPVFAPDDPSVAANLQLWLRNAGANYNGTTWFDESGHNRHASAVSGYAAGTPAALTSSSGPFASRELDAVFFDDAASDLMVSSNLNGNVTSTDWTVFVVYGTRGTSNTDRPAGIGSRLATNLTSNLLLASDGTVRFDNGYNSGGTVPSASGSLFLRAVRLDSGALSEWRDGVANYLNDSTATSGSMPNPASTDDFYLGDLHNFLGTDDADAHIVEVVVYNSALTNAQVGEINNYLLDITQKALAPTVTGLDQAGAEADIIGAGLVVGNVTSAYSSTVPVGNVISQSPMGGLIVDEGSSVALVVSLGPVQVTVPAVTGLPLASADSNIVAAGLVTGVVTSVNSATVPAGDVISQSPNGGLIVDEGSAIVLVVSLGPVQVTVPNIEGLVQADAESDLVAAGLVTGDLASEYSNTVPTGSVISQSPIGGVTVDEGSSVNLVVSLGPVQVAVPNVTNITQAAAQSNLVAAGLVTGAVTSAYSNTFPVGNVISQSPSGGVTVDEGSSVNLVVSLGPVQVAVPNVTNITQAAAQSNLVAAGLVTGAVTSAYSNTFPVGNVISQSPSGGVTVDEGSSVNLVVSLGPVQVAVPNVTNITQAAAQSNLVAAGLVTGAVTSAYSNTFPVGNVISQSPSGGVTVDEGSSVSIVVSLGPVQVAVPNVTNITQAAAQSNLIAAGLVTGTVTSANSSTVPTGSVISQSPIGGVIVDENSSVNLVVSLGPVQVTVPDVTNLAQAVAQSSLVSAGLVTGTVTSAYSSTVPTGSVISQSPNGGVIRDEGTSVNLVVSLGLDHTPKLVRTTVNGVSNTAWTTISLGKAYHSPVIVATPIYPSATLPPVVTRIRNVTSTGFDLKVDRADGLTAAVSFSVSIVAVDEGVYTQAVDGVTMEAVKYTSTVTAEDNSWVAEARTFQNSYTNPVVVGQVMSANDPGWSVFWSMGSSPTNPVNSTNLNVGKHVGEDPDITRANELIGYIVIESGSGTIDGIAYVAALGADSIRGFTNSSTPYTYNLSGGLSSASSAAASISGMDGANGGWAVLSGNPALTSTKIGLHACEDKMFDTEQLHNSTQVAYIVFE